MAARSSLPRTRGELSGKQFKRNDRDNKVCIKWTKSFQLQALHRLIHEGHYPWIPLGAPSRLETPVIGSRSPSCDMVRPLWKSWIHPCCETRWSHTSTTECVMLLVLCFIAESYGIFRTFTQRQWQWKHKNTRQSTYLSTQQHLLCLLLRYAAHCRIAEQFS